MGHAWPHLVGCGVELVLDHRQAVGGRRPADGGAGYPRRLAAHAPAFRRPPRPRRGWWAPEARGERRGRGAGGWRGGAGAAGRGRRWGGRRAPPPRRPRRPPPRPPPPAAGAPPPRAPPPRPPRAPAAVC